MKIRNILSVVAAIAAVSVCSVSAFAAYTPVIKETEGNTYTVEIKASDIDTTATQFTVVLTEGAKVVDYNAVSGGLFNVETMRYAWAGVEAPADDAVMLTLNVEVPDNATKLGVQLKGDEGVEANISTDEVVVEIAPEETETPTDEATVETEEITDEVTEEATVETEEITDEVTEETTDEVTEETTDGGLIEIEGSTETGSETAESDESGEATGTETNPDTGVTLAVLPALVSGAMVLVSKKRK